MSSAKRIAFLLPLMALPLLFIFAGSPLDEDPRLTGAYRRPPIDGWTFVHLEGTPATIGFQHGFLLAEEIADFKAVAEIQLRRDTRKDWAFFRDRAQSMFWPKIEEEYRHELQGVAEGIKARGGTLDIWDIVALNGYLEWEYYTDFYDKLHGGGDSTETGVPERCSAFVATGSWTADGRIIIAHNNWSTYLDGTRWTYVFDVVPTHGHRIIMDGAPGFIASADDFGMNEAGILITETTISGFHGFDTTGIPEFVRGRKAMQYASSIDDFSRIMTEGNNGGYANMWLVADRKTNEIASLELGLKNVTLRRTKDGYFVGSNFPQDPRLTAEETTCDPSDSGRSCFARKRRWEELMTSDRGKISVTTAQRYMGDHYDAFQGKIDPNERTLCGHIELSPRGSLPWQKPFGPAGTVQSKVADARMAEEMSFMASAGHSCGLDFDASSFLTEHPEYSWQKPLLRDMPARPWSLMKR